MAKDKNTSNEDVLMDSSLDDFQMAMLQLDTGKSDEEDLKKKIQSLQAELEKLKKRSTEDKEKTEEKNEKEKKEENEDKKEEVKKKIPPRWFRGNRRDKYKNFRGGRGGRGGRGRGNRSGVFVYHHYY